MNAAAKTLSQVWLFEGEYRDFSISKESFALILLFILVLASALSIVYVKNLERQLTSELQTIQRDANQLRVEWGQLLLEHTTWATPPRVQQIAQQELLMFVPTSQQTVLYTSQRKERER